MTDLVEISCTTCGTKASTSARFQPVAGRPWICGPCRDAAYRKTEASQEAARLRDASGIPPRYDKAKIEPCLEEMMAVYQQASAWAAVACSPGTLRISPSVCLAGEVGRGKTYLACAVANKLADGGLSVKFLRLPELFIRLKDSYKGTRPVHSKARDEATSVALLILDEVGRDGPTPHKWTSWEITALEDIVAGRVDKLLPTFWTTNLEPRDLWNELGERIASRMKRAEIWRMAGWRDLR